MDISNLNYDYEDDYEELTPEEEAAQRRAEARLAREEMIGEMYNARFSFD